MVYINLKCLPILCFCFTGLHSESREPWVWPATFVDDGANTSVIEFTCGAYLKAREWLTWYREVPRKNICTQIEQKFDGYRTLKLIWPLALLSTGNKVYCVKSVPVTKNWQTTWSEARNDVTPIVFQKDRIAPLTDDEGPWLTPKTFVDDGGLVIEFTCWAYLYETEFLSWYQIHDSINRTRLGMIQQETQYGYMKIKLRKTLEPSDNGTQIYCARHKENGKVRETASQRISLKFQRESKHFETAYVTVQPSADIVFFDEADELEFVCGGSEPADGRALTWHLQAPGLRQLIPPVQSYHKSTNMNYLTLPMEVAHHRSRLYCTQDFTFKFLNGTVMRYGERLSSRMITLLHRGQYEPGVHPQVLPEHFVDDRKPFVQFTCYMFLQTGQILSWYQSKVPGSAHSDDTLLKLVQLQNAGTKEGEWVVLTLNKTLEQADNGSEIYCAQQSVRADGSFSDVLSETKRIPLTFQRDIPPLVNAFVTVEPNNTTVYFDVKTTLRLTCSGNKPVDGRNYTWFKKDSESRLTVLEDQKYDETKNQNVLVMSLNETHHLDQLVCVQGFLSYIRHKDGSSRCKIFGELTKPKIITLIRREKIAEKQMTLPTTTIPATNQTTSHTCLGETNVMILAVAILLAFTTLLTSAVACCSLRRSRSATLVPPPSTNPAGKDYDDNGHYANVPRKMTSPQVTYAVLDLPQRASGAARAPPAAETALYAEICKR